MRGDAECIIDSEEEGRIRLEILSTVGESAAVIGRGGDFPPAIARVGSVNVRAAEFFSPAYT